MDAPNHGGHYSFFQIDGKDVAGLRHAEAGTHRWVPYVSVESADRATERALQRGATIITSPFDMPGFSRLSVLQDPGGGTLGFWEPRGHNGARLVNQPGTLWWIELLTNSVEAVKSFYAGVFGWTADFTTKYGQPMNIMRLNAAAVAGVLEIGRDWGVTPRWQVDFAINDCDAKLTQLEALGGSVEFGPNNIPNAGRGAVVRDAGNAVFCMMWPNSLDQEQGVVAT